MTLTFRYRILPSKSQHKALESILEDQRQLYNAALQERIEAYRKAGVSRTYFDQQRALTELRQSESAFRAVPANLQRATLKRVDEAYRRFFQRVRTGTVPGFPRFKGKGLFNSFGFREFSGIRLEANRIRFKGMPGSLRAHLHRPLPAGARILSCTFRRSSKGWHVGFDFHVSSCGSRVGVRAVGVDLGVKVFAALSDGGFIPSLRAARRAERTLRISQRALARKKSGSRSRVKSRAVVAKCHAAVARKRANYLHQASARLIREYDAIVIEALNVKGLARGVLAKDVHDASWRKFISMLRYKAEKAGANLIEVNPRNTTQDCSGCGGVVRKELGASLHQCPACGLSLDRDLNAARNILHRAGVGPGLPNVAGGRGMRADGNLGTISPSAKYAAESSETLPVTWS